MRTNLARSLLLLGFAVLNVQAQESDTDAAASAARAAEMEALEPGVSSDALASGSERTAGPSGNEAESEPAVPGAVVAQDVRRRESSTGVMDEIDLARTEITGNQELPKVLYIVPWQKSDPGQLTGKPVNSLLDEVLAPIDRSEFIRHVDYYGDLNEEVSSNENE